MDRQPWKLLRSEAGGDWAIAESRPLLPEVPARIVAELGVGVVVVRAGAGVAAPVVGAVEGAVAARSFRIRRYSSQFLSWRRSWQGPARSHDPCQEGP